VAFIRRSSGRVLLAEGDARHVDIGRAGGMAGVRNRTDAFAPAARATSSIRI
jgi:hypothetical protein